MPPRKPRSTKPVKPLNLDQPLPRFFTLEQSKILQKRAEKVIPGGVDSPARAFKAVGGDPPFIVRGAGSRMYDADGNDYIDYVCSWGPLILGHAFPPVVEAIEKAARDGSTFGASTPIETELAELVVSAYPSIEKVRFVNSGTEAAMSAIRLARAFTKRNYILKFQGCYHGHADALLIKAGSGGATLGIPDSAGVPEEFTQLTITADYNDLDAVKDAFKRYKDNIAAVIVEPVVGNMGVVIPAPGFLEGLRDITKKDGALLIFDEVMTGFRLAFGGAQELYRIKPDITCLGKILGGGLPVGAYGASAKIMAMVAPLGPMYQAGTLSGNPLSMAAGLATLNHLNQNRDIYDKLEYSTNLVADSVRDAAKAAGVDLIFNRIGSMFTWFFTNGNVWDHPSAMQSDTGKFAKFHRAMLEAGVYLPPSQFEAAFVSAAHTPEDINATIEAAKQAFKAL
ncbi:MAG: glutamate-1-semialdehyde 2,1-aminomutase [Terriglobales bacterium]